MGLYFDSINLVGIMREIFCEIGKTRAGKYGVVVCNKQDAMSIRTKNYITHSDYFPQSRLRIRCKLANRI